MTDRHVIISAAPDAAGARPTTGAPSRRTHLALVTAATSQTQEQRLSPPA